MVDDSRTTEAMVDDRLCDNESTRAINSTSTLSDRVVDGDKCSSLHGGLTCILRDDGSRTMEAMVDDSRTTEAMVDDRLCDNESSTRMINSTSTISDCVVDGDKCSSSGVFEDFSGVDGKRTVQATVADCHRGDCTRTMVVAVKPPYHPPAPSLL